MKSVYISIFVTFLAVEGKLVFLAFLEKNTLIDSGTSNLACVMSLRLFAKKYWGYYPYAT